MRNRLVARGPHHRAAEHDHRADRNLSGGLRFFGQGQGLPHIGFVHGA